MFTKTTFMAVVLSGTALFAGGGVSPVTQENTKKSVTEGSSDLYAGIGIGRMVLENDTTGESFKANAVTLAGGWKFYEYLAIEARYTHHIGDVKYKHGNDNRINGGVDISDYPTDFTNIGVYLKPQYNYENFGIYALLGYGYTELTNIPVGSADRGESGFQWGVGVSYDATESVYLFADYRRLYDDKGFDYIGLGSDIQADVWNIGFGYRF